MREASCSSQHGDAIGCSLGPYCKFEITLELFTIWLVEMKLSRQSDYEIYFWVVVPSKKTEVSCSSQHGDTIGCSLNSYCKFEINLRLFAIWLVSMKFTPIIAYVFVGIL